MKRKMSKKERIILERAKELKYPTDALGPGSLMTQQTHTNASRLIMVNHNLPHMVSIRNPESPQVITAFERPLARFNDMNDETDLDYEIVAKFEKNEFIYVLIGYNKEKRVYHAWKREEVEEHSEGFATRYKNNYIDSIEVGDIVPKGTMIKKAESFDKHMNYLFGRNLNTVYLVSTKVYEDGILLMNDADKKLITTRSNTITINLADNEVLLNLYGDDKDYQGIPLAGEKTHNGYLAVVRQIDGSKAPYALKKKRLRQIERGDRKLYASGKVSDITILLNKDRSKIPETEANRVILELYDKQQKYYKDLYTYMISIVDGASDGKYTYTDEFSILCEEAHDFVDASAFWADSNDAIYGNMQINISLIEDEKLIVGSKLVGRYGNKGVIAKILPKEESWYMEDGTPIEAAVAALGIVGRLNQAQMNEHSINARVDTAIAKMKKTESIDKKGEIIYRLLKYFNKDEAQEFKKYFNELDIKKKSKLCRRVERDGIIVVQDPIDNANILDVDKSNAEFPPKFQRIVFPDGSKSIKKVICAKLFFIRLKQDPVEKYSVRSYGPINPITNLPAKSTRKKRFLDPYSDVAVRLGESEMEVLLTMVNHPAAIADFMTENSTSLELKMAIEEKEYIGDTFNSPYLPDLDDDDEISDDDVVDSILDDVEDVTSTSKKNMEHIIAMTNVLGTEIEITTETAPDGEYFYD